MGVEPGGAPLRPEALLWVDRWLRGESRETFTQIVQRENVQKTRCHEEGINHIFLWLLVFVSWCGAAGKKVGGVYVGCIEVF